MHSVDKCDWERRRPLQDLNEQLLSAGVKGDLLEIKHLHGLGANLQYRGVDEQCGELGLPHYAAQRGDAHIMRYLLAQGSQPYAQVLNSGQTVVHIAAYRGHVGLLKWMFSKRHVFDFNAVDRRGGGVSHYAVLGDKLDVVKWLHQDVSNTIPQILKQVDLSGIKPISLAKQLNKEDIYDFLVWAHTSKQARKVRSLFFRSVSAHANEMLLGFDPAKNKERACFRLQKSWRTKKALTDKATEQKFHTTKHMEEELLNIHKMIDDINKQDEQERAATVMEIKKKEAEKRKEKAFIEAMRFTDKQKKIKSYREDRVAKAVNAARCVLVAEKKTLALTVSCLEIFDTALKFLSDARSVPSGTEKINFLTLCLEKLDRCSNKIEETFQIYSDAVKWKLETMKIAYDIELENFCNVKFFSADFFEKVRGTLSLAQLINLTRQGSEKIEDTFPALNKNEANKFFAALTSGKIVRVQTGVLHLEETRAQKKAREKKKKTRKEIEEEEKADAEYGLWVRHAYDQIDEANKHLIQAKFYKKEAMSVEKKVKESEQEASDMLSNGVEMPMGYDPYCSKLNLPPFARRIKRVKKRCEAHNTLADLENQMDQLTAEMG